MKILILIFLNTIILPLFAQKDTVQLIEPNGPYPVGTIIYEWTDEKRNINITKHQGEKRTIIVQLWYPAKVDSTDQKASYSSLSRDYQKVISNSYLRPAFSNEIENSNLVIICPGRGTERYLYTTIIEELASYGYTVASVDMPDIGYVIYQDGLIIKPSDEFQPPQGMMGGPYEKVDAFFERPTEIGFEDLELAFQKISELNLHDPNQRFNNKINLAEMGIVGHSLGGRIAGKYTFENENVKAFISMEGIPPRDIRYEGKISIPQAMLCSSGTWPYAKENYYSLINNRTNTVYMIELLDFGHNSITDNPFIYPENYNYTIEPALGLEISRKIILSYLDAQLKNGDEIDVELQNINQINIQVHK